MKPIIKKITTPLLDGVDLNKKQATYGTITEISLFGLVLFRNEKRTADNMGISIPENYCWLDNC